MDNPNTITYDEGWQSSTSQADYTSVHSEEYANIEPKTKVKTKISVPLVTIIQLILCFIIVISAFVIKNYGGDFYKQAHNWYIANLNNEIIMNRDFDNFSLDNLIKSINSLNDTKNKKS